MIRDVIIEFIKKPYKIPSQIKKMYKIYTKKIVPFTYEGVAPTNIPIFSARLYREVRLLNKAIGNFHAKKSLEIGCGYGRLTPWIAEHSDQHYAIEPESFFLNNARKLYPNVYFHNSIAQKLPFPNEFFDLCVSWTVLQHIPPKELTKAVTEIKRVCRPEAIIILAEEVGKKVFARARARISDTWVHTIEEWKQLFLPWTLTWSTERKIEEIFKGKAGLVMRFKRIDQTSS